MRVIEADAVAALGWAAAIDAIRAAAVSDSATGVPPRTVVVLGAFGWAALWPALRQAKLAVPGVIPPFAHGATVELDDGRRVLGCYHVSQQNTFTGRLTEPMLDAVLGRAVLLAGGLPAVEV